MLVRSAAVRHVHVADSSSVIFKLTAGLLSVESELDVGQFLRERLRLLTTEVHRTSRSTAYDVRSCTEYAAAVHSLEAEVDSHMCSRLGVEYVNRKAWHAI